MYKIEEVRGKGMYTHTHVNRRKATHVHGRTGHCTGQTRCHAQLARWQASPQGDGPQSAGNVSPPDKRKKLNTGANN